MNTLTFLRLDEQNALAEALKEWRLFIWDKWPKCKGEFATMQRRHDRVIDGQEMGR